MYFLAIQHTYHCVELALFTTTPFAVIASLSIPKEVASREILIHLDQLLTQNNCSLSNLEFIAVNQGPGPFTTLRVVIATVNGLSFARTLALVGVNGLHAFLQEHLQPTATTVALLNAFNQDVYFGVAQRTTITHDGYENNTVLIERLLAQLPDGPIHFIGNAVSLYRSQLEKSFGSRAVIIDPLPEMCSIQQLGYTGLLQWQACTNICFQIIPLYLKPFNAASK
jgi:tRNA threonylcarbamoyladenosine biosynthesis protein TsaB